MPVDTTDYLIQETYLSLTGRAQHHTTVLPVERDSSNNRSYFIVLSCLTKI